MMKSGSTAGYLQSESKVAESYNFICKLNYSKMLLKKVKQPPFLPYLSFDPQTVHAFLYII